MSVSDPAELKRKLRSAGFEIYRTAAPRVMLAERVRDNLIMDSGVAATVSDGSALGVEVTVKSQASHFPGATEEQLWESARKLAQAFAEAGYRETNSTAEPLADPSDPSQSLDTSYEIQLEREVGDLDALFAELRAALGRRRSTADD